MPVDPVAIAFAQAGKNRQELDALSARQRQVGQDTMQAANMFRSWGDRAQAMEEGRRQFNVTQDLRERQFALNQQQSMAELAATKVHQDREALMLREQQRNLDEQPMKDAANATLFGALSNVQTEAQLQDAYRKVASDPLVAKYVPPQQLQSSFLGAKQTLLQGEAQVLAQANATKDQEIRNEYLRLGGRLEDVTNPESGQIDFNTLKMATGELQRASEARKLAAQTSAQKELITARGDQSVRALQEKEDAMVSKISDVTQRAKFQEYMKMARSAVKEGNDAEARQWESRADGIFGGSQQAPPTTSVQEISTKSERDALPKGTSYIYGGQKYIKQ